jgi:hypothetical protein
MQILKPGVAAPAAHFLYHGIRDSIEFELHSAGCTKGVRANSKEIIALEPNHESEDGAPNATGHLSGCGMLIRGVEAQDRVGIVWGTGSHLDKPPGRSFVRA